MKKNILTLIIGILIISCSDDDNEMDSFDTSLIEGIWKFNSDNTYYMTDGSVNFP